MPAPMLPSAAAFLFAWAAPAAAAVDQASFDSVLAAVDSVYKPVAASRGGVLRLRGNWENGMVEALSRRIGDRWVIDVFGGLARHPAITPDGLAAVVCHEVGHHLGGAPKRGSDRFPWASGEGQADYFAALKCLRIVLPVLPDSAAPPLAPAELSVAVKACAGVYPVRERAALCVRESLAGLSFIRLFSDIRGEAPPTFLTHDPREAFSTDDDYPSAQCRLDTFFQGSLCAKPVAEEVDDRDHGSGACTRAGGDPAGWRPACWYRPPPLPALVSSDPPRVLSTELPLVLANLDWRGGWPD